VLGPYGIRVNAVLPGTIESTMIEGMDHDAMAAGILLRRIGTPDDVTRLSLWLASDQSAGQRRRLRARRWRPRFHARGGRRCQ
jgi:NAD(P)-dependent dehydrogenase (short-subunit alcohol dehydrogenase family)